VAIDVKAKMERVMRVCAAPVKFRLGRVFGSALFAAMALLVVPPEAAEARGGVSIGVGVGVYGGGYGGGYYPYPPYYYHRPHYYYPPPYYYYPPPPPSVIYVPAPTPVPAPPAATTNSVPTASQANCREYESSSTIDGRPQKIVGTACLQPDGTWRIIR